MHTVVAQRSKRCIKHIHLLENSQRANNTCVSSFHCKVNTYNTMEVVFIQNKHQSPLPDRQSVVILVWRDIWLCVKVCSDFNIYIHVFAVVLWMSRWGRCGLSWAASNSPPPQLLACYSNPGPQPRPLTWFLHTLQWPWWFNTPHHMQLDKTNIFSKHLFIKHILLFFFYCYFICVIHDL